MDTRTSAISLLAAISVTVATSVSGTEAVRVERVNSSATLHAAMKRANGSGFTEIVLDPGRYRIRKTLRIRASHIAIRSSSGKYADTVLVGNGMRAADSVDNLIEVSGQHVSITGLTLRDAGNHLIQVRGERNADHFTLKDSALINAYQQLLKVSADASSEISADFGTVSGSLFAYENSLGPNFYIGGIDAHKGKNWIVEENSFHNIASPANQVAEFAIHFWSQSANNKVRNNFILNCDRGIGFGLGKHQHRRNDGGEISGNTIFHPRTSNPFSDVGIALENSPDTVVNDNTVLLRHNYPNAIEYRFPGTQSVIIKQNTLNRAVRSRNQGSGSVFENRKVSSDSEVWARVAKIARKHDPRFSE
ncbi:MAG: right-handed parallel beta-helix repeat-containing protein [Pseudomonadota bacterium]